MVSCAKGPQNKSAHKKDHNWEPFVENETMNKRVHENRFPNLLVTTDVSGHNLGTFFEKVPNFKKGSQLGTLSSGIQTVGSCSLGSFQKGSHMRGSQSKSKDHKHPVTPVATSSRCKSSVVHPTVFCAAGRSQVPMQTWRWEPNAPLGSRQMEPIDGSIGSIGSLNWLHFGSIWLQFWCCFAMKFGCAWLHFVSVVSPLAPLAPL